MADSEHLDDAQLARLLDDQLDGHARVVCEAHLDVCSECRSTLAGLRRQASSVRESLVATDVPVPSMSFSPPQATSRRVFRFVAVAVAASLTLMLAIAPVRAWVAENVRGLGARLVGGESQSVTVVADSAIAPVPNRVAVSIPTSGEVLRIRLASHQPQGSLWLVGFDGSTPRAAVLGGSTERLVLADGLVVQNQPSSTASYRVSVPVGMVVDVVVANTSSQRVELASASDSTEVVLFDR